MSSTSIFPSHLPNDLTIVPFAIRSSSDEGASAPMRCFAFSNVSVDIASIRAPSSNVAQTLTTSPCGPCIRIWCMKGLVLFFPFSFTFAPTAYRSTIAGSITAESTFELVLNAGSATISPCSSCSSSIWAVVWVLTPTALPRFPEYPARRCHSRPLLRIVH